MAEVRLEGVTKRFGELVVADGLSLAIADGEFFAFLGPSGCGKSTLLHIVAGIEPPSTGRVWIGGRDVTAAAPQHRDVAMVFQSYALYPHLDAYENIAFPLRNRGVSGERVRAEVERVARMLGLTGLLAKRPRALSGGERQRVALGRALVRRPAVFLMDEPLSNLDAALRLEIREEIKRVHQAHGITTVYVTHDQEEALALSDRLAVLRGGRIQQCDAPANVYARPADTFVARFVGSPPMNLVPAADLMDDAGLAARLAGRDPAGVTVGLRPQHVEVQAAARPGAPRLEVVLLEPAGAETWVIGSLRGTRVQGKLGPGERLAPGGHASLAFAPDVAHLFATASGLRLD
jgi:ABC-type sugar transport system ATPase subunit